MPKPRAIYLCGGGIAQGANGCRLDTDGENCKNAGDHAPMPMHYADNASVGEARIAAGQHNRRCDGCGRFRLWTGGRDVQGWPRRMSELTPP